MNPTVLDCDVLVIGGGINGAGIARDAAGRGMSVVLCEKDDLASHTSSASSKLIHGGLRYLQYYEFGLVRKALIEREVLMRSAPHLIAPLRFVMPHAPGLRPAWMLRAGLFLYDHLASRKLLGGSQGIDLRRHTAGAPLKSAYRRGFTYFDAAVDDARLVVANVIDAAERGARVLTRTECIALAPVEGLWVATLRGADGPITGVRARCLVNAGGSWAMRLRQRAVPAAKGGLRLVKGSHIVVKRLFAHDDAYIFQHADGRIVFAIPYQGDYTLIGTTDLDYEGDMGKVEISPEEVAYLCELGSVYFKLPVRPADVVWSYAGVRPLVDDGAGDAKAVTRDYQLLLDDDTAPVLSVFGGKITTYRKLAEEAVDRVAAVIGASGKAWTAGACLPGGDIHGKLPDNRSVTGFGLFVRDAQRRYGWLPARLVTRYAHAYGSRIHRLLEGCDSIACMGRHFAADLYEREVRYLIDAEWARGADDVLWRRTKLGLRVGPAAVAALSEWMLRHA
ncbi:glycerol-3-phosphate dehydrogenase [Duganella rhizosphaerae]|uniref:glycerol-3-phosphate dehydrogenase n=1 Tax=Duganella rhizosphaerae TaxID=2885763 RepID=UPI0030EACC30